MPANTSPIFGLTPNISHADITTAAVVTGSIGIGTLATNMFPAFTAGANGSFVQKVRFMSVARTAAITSVPTTLRLYYSTVGSGTTSATNTSLIGEVSVPAISTANSTNATNFYDYPLNFAIPSGSFIHVSQHVAQTTDQNWTATVIGSNY
jgi:hypothetical protein